MFNSKSRECDTVYKKSNSVTFIFLLLLFSVLAVTLFVDNVTETPEPTYERNYEGEYYLGLIPNAPELPATKSDIILAQGPTKEMIKSPFGYVYLRDR